MPTKKRAAAAQATQPPARARKCKAATDAEEAGRIREAAFKEKEAALKVRSAELEKREKEVRDLEKARVQREEENIPKGKPDVDVHANQAASLRWQTISTQPEEVISKQSLGIRERLFDCNRVAGGHHLTAHLGRNAGNSS